MAWVHDRIFAAGGSHIPATWSSFREQMGINAICSLNTAGPTVFLGGPPTSFLWLDIPDEAAADLPVRLLAGRFINSCVAAGERVLLHSGQGRHRTRWAYVAFLILSGKSVASAIRSGAERPWLAPYETDRKSWQQVADHMESSSKGLTF